MHTQWKMNYHLLKTKLLPIKQFNVCRINLRKKFLSEICNANGNELNPGLIDYAKTKKSISRLRWSNQPKPNEKYGKA